MPTEPPPGRYKVVERGRRLQVIDTRYDQQPRLGAPKALRSPKSPLASIGRLIVLALAGGATNENGDPLVETQPFYDFEAPRLVVVNRAAQQRIAAAALGIVVLATVGIIVTVLIPASLTLAFVLALAPVQSRLRRRATRWIDDIQADVAGSKAG